MVTFITGPINSGKTTFIKNFYEKTKTGDGFISIKIMQGNQVEGYDLVQLSTGDKKSFIRVIGNEPSGWAENCRIGQYTISDESLKWVAETVEKFIKSGVFPIFLDEIGDLEIGGKCFFEILTGLLDCGLDLYLTVRDKNLSPVIDSFGITGAKNIKMGERYA